MRVYFITQKFMGEFAVIDPRVPISGSLNESSTPRICVSMSILGALCSIYSNLYIECNTYIYCTDIKPDELYQPIKEVSDIDMTGELWILHSESFYLHKVIRLSHEYGTFKALQNLKEQEENRHMTTIGQFRFYDVRRGEHDC